MNKGGTDTTNFTEALEPEVPYRNILVCLDGSSTAERALPLAEHIAKMARGRLTLLRVLESPLESTSVHAADAIAWEARHLQARSYLGGIVDGLLARDVPAAFHIAEGVAATEIATWADSLGADLIVLTSHGEGAADQEPPWELGSTAHKVLALVREAVIIVPTRGGSASTPLPTFDRVFVPLDGSPRGECVLPAVLRLVRADACEVLLAHVVDDPVRTEVLCTEEDLSLAGELSERLVARARAYLQQVRSQLGSEAPRVRILVDRAKDHRATLVDWARDEQADIVILSAHGTVCDARRRFGSVTAYFLAQCPVPVWVIQDLNEPVSSAPGRPRRTSRLPPRASADGSSG